MSDHTTVFKVEAQRELRKVPREQAVAILRRLAELEGDLFAFGTTASVGEPGQRRMRIGGHRVVYTFDDGQLIIVAVQTGHRSTVYG